MFIQLKKFFTYLLGKTSEIGELDTKDLLLAKVVLDIHRKKTHAAFVPVPLFAIKQLHAIDRENALQATEKRVAELLKVKEAIKENGLITREILAQYLPSVSWIKVVKERNDSYIAYEGNGRVVAMQKVFSPDDGITVEVEEYYFKRPGKILRRMHRVRKMNGFSSEG